jgi:hypothetical protein
MCRNIQGAWYPFHQLYLGAVYLKLGTMASFVSNSELGHAEGHDWGEANRDMALTCPRSLGLFVKQSLHCVGGYIHQHQQRDLLKGLGLPERASVLTEPSLG